MALPKAADMQQTLHPLFSALFYASYLHWTTHFYTNAPVDFKELKHIRTYPAWISIGQYIPLILLSRFNDRMDMKVVKLEREQQSCYGTSFVGMIWRMGWGTSTYKFSKSVFPGWHLEFTSQCYTFGIHQLYVLGKGLLKRNNMFLMET